MIAVLLLAIFQISATVFTSADCSEFTVEHIKSMSHCASVTDECLLAINQALLEFIGPDCLNSLDQSAYSAITPNNMARFNFNGFTHFDLIPFEQVAWNLLNDTTIKENAQFILQNNLLPRLKSRVSLFTSSVQMFNMLQAANGCKYLEDLNFEAVSAITLDCINELSDNALKTVHLHHLVDVPFDLQKSILVRKWTSKGRYIDSVFRPLKALNDELVNEKAEKEFEERIIADIKRAKSEKSSYGKKRKQKSKKHLTNKPRSNSTVSNTDESPKSGRHIKSVTIDRLEIDKVLSNYDSQFGTSE